MKKRLKRFYRIATEGHIHLSWVKGTDPMIGLQFKIMRQGQQYLTLKGIKLPIFEPRKDTRYVVRCSCLHLWIQITL